MILYIFPHIFIRKLFIMMKINLKKQIIILEFFDWWYGIIPSYVSILLKSWVFTHQKPIIWLILKNLKLCNSQKNIYNALQFFLTYYNKFINVKIALLKRKNLTIYYCIISSEIKNEWSIGSFIQTRNNIS